MWNYAAPMLFVLAILSWWRYDERRSANQAVWLKRRKAYQDVCALLMAGGHEGFRLFEKTDNAVQVDYLLWLERMQFVVDRTLRDDRAHQFRSRVWRATSPDDWQQEHWVSNVSNYLIHLANRIQPEDINSEFIDEGLTGVSRQ